MTAPLPPPIPRDARDASSYFHRNRPLFWCALAWIGGILLDDALALPVQFVPQSAAILFLSGLAGHYTLRGSPALLALALAAFAGGFATHAMFVRSARAEFASAVSGKASDLQLTGVIVQSQILRSGGARWILRVEQHEDSAGPERLDGRIQLFVRTPPPQLLEGSRVRLRAALEPPRDTLPDGFDAVAWLRNNGILLVGELGPEHPIETLPPSRDPVLLLRRFSHGLSGRLPELLPALTLDGREPGSQAGLLNALLFGRRERIDRADRDAFAATGTAHLLAISGLQIQFLAFLFWLLARRSGLPRRVNALLLFIATWAYTALSGAEPPIVRAAIMISLFLLGQWAERESDPLSLLGAAAMLILAFDPSQLFQAGFQLSFIAVFALLVFVPLFGDALKRRTHDDPLAQFQSNAPDMLRRRLASLALVSFAAWLATAPVVAWHMKQFSPLCVPMNLLAVPLSSMAMLCGLGALAFGFIPPLAAVFAWSAFALIALLQTLTDLATASPFGALHVSPPPAPLLLLSAAAALWVWWRRSTRRLEWRAAALCAFVLLGVAANPAHSPEPSPVVTLLDLPRGRAILLQNGSDAVLIEAGGPSSGALVANILESRGVRRLKAALALESGHFHIGGLAGALSAIPAEHVLLPRDLSPGTARLALERTLRARGIASSTDPRSLPPDLLAGFTLQIVDDSALRLDARSESSVLAVKIACGESTLLLLPANSDAALRRLAANAPPGFFAVQTLCLCGTARPASLHASLLPAGSPARVLDLSGQEPPRDSGSHFISFLNPHRSIPVRFLRSGSLRLLPRRDPSADGWELNVYEDARWRRAR